MSIRREADVIERLRRLEGQVRGIERMVRDGRYCVDILTQLAAARGALQEVERILLRAHLQTCVANVMKSGTAGQRERTIDEILSVLNRVER